MLLISLHTFFDKSSLCILEYNNLTSSLGSLFTADLEKSHHQRVSELQRLRSMYALNSQNSLDLVSLVALRQNIECTLLLADER